LTKVLNVEYFDAINKNTDFIGVKVSSTNGRTDHIYNDQNANEKHEFKSGAFKGSYGITSFQDGDLKSLLLGFGSLLSYDLWSISAAEDEGGVNIKIGESNLIVDAEKPFRLSVPSKYLNGATNLETVDIAGKQILFQGTLQEVNNAKVIVFEMPKMQNAILTPII